MKRRALPSKWNCLGKQIKIRTRPNLILDGRPCYGYFDHEKATIWISSDIDDETLFFETLAHEAMHAIHWRTGLWQEPHFQNQHEQQAETHGNALGSLLVSLVALHTKRPHAEKVKRGKAAKRGRK